MRRTIVAGLILAVAAAAPAAAQDRLKDKVSINAMMGAGISGSNPGVDLRISSDVKLNNWVSVVGEWGTVSKADFRSVDGPLYSGVSGYHLNGNLKATYPVPAVHLEPYATFGLGTFVSSPGPFGDRHRADLASNFGAGLRYDIKKWIGITTDYRRFRVNVVEPRATNRFTVGIDVGIR